jgi:hypothetical protein
MSVRRVGEQRRVQAHVGRWGIQSRAVAETTWDTACGGVLTADRLSLNLVPPML